MMYALKQAYQLLWHIPIAITWLIMGLFITLGFGVGAFDKFIIHWNNMVNDIGDDVDPHVPTLPDDSGYKQEK
jgi:hypothetical protein